MLMLFARNINYNRLFFVLKKRVSQYATKFYQTRATVSKDATIFYHDRRKFFRLVGIASGSQFLFWMYLARFHYTTRPQLLEISGNETSYRSESKAWKIVTYIEKSPVFLSVFAVSVGIFLLATGWIYCLRNVNRIVLLRGGRTVHFVTHTPLGGTRSFSTPIEHVSSLGSRIDTKSQIAVKVKGYNFFFIVDKEGSFVQPSLFDSVVGVNRRL